MIGFLKRLRTRLGGTRAVPHIFISYRRGPKGDPGGPASELHSYLAGRYGSRRVFRDIDILGGQDWRDRLDTELRNCSVIAAVIGPAWEGEGRDGQREIDFERDWVRYEICRGVDLEKPIVPILVGGRSASDPMHPIVAQLADRHNFVRVDSFYTKAGHANVGKALDGHLGLWARRRVRMAMYALLGVATVAAALLWGREFLRPPPLVFTENRGVAVSVAENTPSGAFNSDERTEAFAEDLADALRSSLPADEFDIAGVPRSLALVEPDPDEREAEAEELLAETNAELVVNILMMRREGGTELFPELFVGAITDLEELSGRRLDYAFERDPFVSTDIWETNTVDDDRDLVQQLKEELAPLVPFLEGIDRYAIRDFTGARETLGPLVGPDTRWQGLSLAVLHQMLGGSNSALGDYETAYGHYDAALAADPGFYRARLGRAEATYLQAHGKCSASDIQVSGVEEANATYEELASDSTLDELVLTKAELGWGRGLACLRRAVKEDVAPHAAVLLGGVVDHGLGSDARPIRETVVEAAFELATLIEFLDIEDPEAATSAIAAAGLAAESGEPLPPRNALIRLYELAADKSNRPARSGDAHMKLARLRRNSDEDAAAVARGSALRRYEDAVADASQLPAAIGVLRGKMGDLERLFGNDDAAAEHHAAAVTALTAAELISERCLARATPDRRWDCFRLEQC